MVLERKKILLVDPDQEGMRPLKTLLLQRGCRVGQVDSGEHALQVCARELPDAIITGLQLPKMSGEELLRALREEPRTSGIPVIIIADQRILDDRIRAIELLPDDFVPKPYLPQEVVARLEVLLNEVHSSFPLPSAEDMEKGFSGSLGDMSPVDLIEVFHAASRSGILHLRRNGQHGAIYLRDGEIIDALLGQRAGEEAMRVLLLWREGTFLADFTPVDRPQRITTPTREIVANALARAEDWDEALSVLPPLETELVCNAPPKAMAELDEASRNLLGQFASPKPIAEVLEQMSGDPLPLAKCLRGLWEKGFLRVEQVKPEGWAGSSLLQPHSVASRSPLAAVGELFRSGERTQMGLASAEQPRAAGPLLTRAELLMTRARLT
ncbi:MAG: response regulator [candidate division KSB1 bacterium]|nr:response regulator [candidate division KSB1 bacterium]MDZ7386435.1 response regulator [candidate division KSB1 bacterium]MDZ7393185.1 response regulator [candidate division KSB1 bacterium]MDZ7412758.1 response regulator [candidate division KSB1 bacterium]